MIWRCKHHSPAWWGQQQREALRLTWFWWRKETRENTLQRHMHMHHPEMSYWVMLLLISERQSSTAEVIIPVLLWCDDIFCLVHLQILEVIVKTAADRDGARTVNTCHNSIFFLVNYCCWFCPSLYIIIRFMMMYFLQINFVQHHLRCNNQMWSNMPPPVL